MRPATRQRLRLSGGTELCFITAGEASKPAVLLLHGFPIVTMVAGYVPARQASRIDPVRALRAE